MVATKGELATVWLWKVLVVIINCLVIGFLLNGLMNEADKPMMLLWSLSTFVYVGSLSFGHIKTAFESAEPAEKLTILEYSHLWYRTEKWLENARIQRAMNGVEVVRVALEMQFNPWSQDWKIAFEVPQGGDFHQGVFCRISSTPSTWAMDAMRLVCGNKVETFIFSWELDKGYASIILEDRTRTWRKCGRLVVGAESRTRLEELMVFIHNDAALVFT